MGWFLLGWPQWTVLPPTTLFGKSRNEGTDRLKVYTGFIVKR